MAATLRKLSDGASSALCVFTNPDNTAETNAVKIDLNSGGTGLTLLPNQLGKACTDIADLNIKELGTDVLEDLMHTIASQRPHLLRPAAPPEPPYDPDKVISTPIAAGNLSWKHSVAMTLAAMVTFIAQSAYRFRQTASMVINGVFLVFVLWLYRDSARREAARNRKKGS